jgi:excisionase family DNA binding protein
MTSLVSVREAAQLLKVSRQRIEQFILAGRLPASRIGSYWAIDREDIQRFQEARGVKT